MRNCIFLVLTSAVAAAAFGGEAEQTTRVAHVGMVAPDVIGITIFAGRSEYGKQIPFVKQPGDKIDRRSHNRWLTLGGKFVGSIVGKDENILYTPDRVIGEKLDTAWADSVASYRVRSRDDRGYAGGVSPSEVYRKTKPADFARAGPWNFQFPTESVVYLKMPKPLSAGKRYSISFPGSVLRKERFTYDPARLRSEAVHLSHIGFHPDDPVKVAFLSCWMGSGGPLAYREGLEFQVIEEKSGRVAYRGEVKLSKAADDLTEDAYKKNYNGANVYEMDFTRLTKPGTYRVLVEGIGCSYSFKVAEDVWRGAFRVSARGFYHQRSGVALGPPYTDYKRPRCFHPDDGVTVYATTASLMDTGNGLNRKDSNFGNLVNGKTDEIVPNAWGSYMDAGDWDRRIQHLVVSRLLIELAEIFPDYFAKLSLNIPESNDGLPDVVSEALFNLDCYRRMQTAEGGIRGGIESSEHPRHGEASWQESLDVMAYAPGVWSSYVYAGVAARAAAWLESRKPRLAREYRTSALRAMQWAENELPKREGKNDPHAVKDARNLAAAELFRLTGDKKWNDLFLATTAFNKPGAALYLWKDHDQRDTAWVYVRTRHPGVDRQVQENCRAAILREADERAAVCERTGFRWTKDPWFPPAWSAFSAPFGLSLCRAHVLTGDAKYLRATVLACQSALGANPINICYTTGLGHKWPLHPLHVDSRPAGLTPPPGLTVFGPIGHEQGKKQAFQKMADRTLFPPFDKWPVIEAYWDVFWYPAMCEYTVQQPMARNAFVWGYLAASPRR